MGNNSVKPENLNVGYYVYEIKLYLVEDPRVRLGEINPYEMIISYNKRNNGDDMMVFLSSFNTGNKTIYILDNPYDIITYEMVYKLDSMPYIHQMSLFYCGREIKNYHIKISIFTNPIQRILIKEYESDIIPAINCSKVRV